MPRRLITLLVFAISFGVLAWDINRAGIAAAYNDPIAHIRAQDEAVYVSEAIGMAKDSDWMTPKVMGRPFLLKPPLLVWLSTLSLRLLGLSLFSIRLPALLLGAAGVATVFAWVARARSMAAGVLGGDFSYSALFGKHSRECASRMFSPVHLQPWHLSV